MSGLRSIVSHWWVEEHGHVMAECPECDKVGTLARGTHTVDVDGGVSPSFICPYCGWHGYVRLARWPSSSQEPRP